MQLENFLKFSNTGSIVCAVDTTVDGRILAYNLDSSLLRTKLYQPEQFNSEPPTIDEVESRLRSAKFYERHHDSGPGKHAKQRYSDLRNFLDAAGNAVEEDSIAA